jgi:hypothetical protein
LLKAPYYLWPARLRKYSTTESTMLRRIEVASGK